MATVDERPGGRPLPPHAHVREEAAEYVVELDVSDFTERELVIEVTGHRVAVTAEQLGTAATDDAPFRLHERLEETFRLPDDAAIDGLEAVYRHGTLELRVARRELRPRRVPVTRGTSLVHPDAEGV